MYRSPLKGKEVEVIEVGADAPLTRGVEDRVELQIAPPVSAGSGPLSGWFLGALMLVQLAWIGALAYLLARIFG